MTKLLTSVNSVKYDINELFYKTRSIKTLQNTTNLNYQIIFGSFSDNFDMLVLIEIRHGLVIVVWLTLSLVRLLFAYSLIISEHKTTLFKQTHMTDPQRLKQIEMVCIYDCNTCLLAEGRHT